MVAKNTITDAAAALSLLLEGNNKYISDRFDVHPTQEKIMSLKDMQHPYAAIISCSDSRVPPNEIFDCDLGEIFVVRTAGHVISDFELGSIEYAVEHLKVPLVMVLGHRNCGAVASAFDWTGGKTALDKLMAEVVPSIRRAKKKSCEKNEIIRMAENYNVENSILKLKQSEVISSMADNAVVGAMYDICSGKVDLI